MILFLCAPAVLINLDKVCIKRIQKSLWSIVMNIFCWASAWACKEVSNRQSIHDRGRATWNCLALPQLLVTCVKDQFWYFVLFLYLEKSCLDQLKKHPLKHSLSCDYLWSFKKDNVQFNYSRHAPKSRLLEVFQCCWSCSILPHCWVQTA